MLTLRTGHFAGIPAGWPPVWRVLWRTKHLFINSGWHNFVLNWGAVIGLDLLALGIDINSWRWMPRQLSDRARS